MSGREVLDAKSMLALLEGTGADGGPSVTIDVDAFEQCFGSAGSSSRRRSSISSSRRRSTSSGKNRRESGGAKGRFAL